MIILRWRKRKQPGDITEIESRLQNVMTPLAPRREFVSTLRQQLARYEKDPRYYETFGPSRAILIAAAGFFTGAIILVLGIRAVITILTALGLLHQFGQQGQRRQFYPTRSD